MTHALKTSPKDFEAIRSGERRFDVRKHDRLFTVGETVIFQEWTDNYTGQEESFIISWVEEGDGKNGIKSGYCVFGLKQEVLTFTTTKQ